MSDSESQSQDLQPASKKQKISENAEVKKDNSAKKGKKDEPSESEDYEDQDDLEDSFDSDFGAEDGEDEIANEEDDENFDLEEYIKWREQN